MPQTPSPSTTAATHERKLAPDALMIATVLFLWTSVWRFQELWPIVGKLKISLLLELVVTVLLVVRLASSPMLRWAKSTLFFMPFGLLALMVLGLPTNLWLGQAIIFLTKDFGPTLILYLALVLSIRNRRDLDWYAFAHLIGAVVYAAWTYVFVPVGANARLGDLVYYDANDLGLLIVCSMPFAVYFARPGVAFWKRLFSAGALALFVIMLIKTGSRGGFIAFIAVMAFILIAFGSIPKSVRIGAVVGGALLLVTAGSTAYWDMMRTILHPKNDYNMTADVGRKAIWHRGMGYMVTHPVVGVGVRAFPQAEGMLSSISREFAESGRGLKWSTAHNSFVLVGAELGISGLVLFVAMIGGAFRRLARIRAGAHTTALVSEGDAAYAQMLQAALMGFCIAGFFISATYFPLLYVLIALVVAECGLLRKRYAQAAKSGSAAASHPRPPAVRARPVPELTDAPHWLPTG